MLVIIALSPGQVQAGSRRNLGEPCLESVDGVGVGDSPCRICVWLVGLGWAELGGLGAWAGGVDNRRTEGEDAWRPPVAGNGRRGCSEGKATNSRPCPTA